MTKVLVVDDSEAEITLITELLSDMYVESAHDGIEALEKFLASPDYDVILLDLFMPRLNGFDVLERLREQKEIPPVIIFTNADEVEYEVRGLELGAVDFVRKPVNRRSLHKRIEIQLALQESAKVIQTHNERLQIEVEQRTREALRASEIAIHSLIQLLEVRNIETSNHARRSSDMMELLCQALQKVPTAGYELTDAMVHELVRTAPLHDIGKVGIPDSILLKQDKLATEEYEVMKLHVTYGVQALEFQGTGSVGALAFVETAKQIIQNHHERFNGSGYPQGLSGTDIPLPGRLMAIIDVYDALTSDRVYKKAISHEEALDIIQKERGAHFDPIITEVFVSIGDAIREISKQER